MAVASVSAAPVEVHAPWFEGAETGEPVVNLYFFWSRFCPHCHDALPFVERLSREVPWLKVHNHQLVDEPENVQLYLQLAERVGQVANSVPGFLFCGRMETGWFDEQTTGRMLLNALGDCRAEAIDSSVSLRWPSNTAMRSTL